MLTCGIVILNFNEYPVTEELLSRIKDCPEIEHIAVVDNNSPNDSYTFLKKYESPKVSVIQSGKNGGYSFGNNVGARYLIQNYHPDIIGIANPDTVFDGSLVRKVKELFSANDDYALITGFNLNKDDSSAARPFWGDEGTVLTLYKAVLWEIMVRPFVNFSKKVLHVKKPGKYERWVENIRTSTNALNEVWGVMGCLFFVRADDFLKIGLFDENIFMYDEENILAFKLHKIGKKLGIAGGVSFIHDHRNPKNESPVKRLDRGMNYINLSERSAVYYFSRYITKSIILQAGYKLLMRLRWLKSISAVLVKKCVYRLKGIH